MTGGVFLDRDGVLNRNLANEETGEPRPPWSPDEVELLPGALAAVSELHRAGWPLFVVTNQPDAAKGRVRSQALWETHFAIMAMLREVAPVRDWWVCMHHPQGEGPLGRACECRKPAPGALIYLARVHEIALDRSWMVGDQVRDIEAGRAAGCRCLRIGDSDNGCPSADCVARAAAIIIGESQP